MNTIMPQTAEATLWAGMVEDVHDPADHALELLTLSKRSYPPGIYNVFMAWNWTIQAGATLEKENRAVDQACNVNPGVGIC